MLADKLKMPVDCKDFENLLKQWPCDQDWDEADETQARFKKLKFDRFDMNLTLSFKDVVVTDAYKESFEATTDRGSEQQAAISDQGGQGAIIKIENESWVLMNQKLNTIKQSDRSLNNLLRDLKQLQAVMVNAKDDR